MNRPLRTITLHREKWIFYMECDLSEPCPHCGVPACGKEFYLWVEEEGNKVAISFDGGLFEMLCGDFLSNNLQHYRYKDIPGFMREWNEGKGWSEHMNDHVRISPSALLQALQAMQVSAVSQWLEKDMEKYTKVFSVFAQWAIEEKKRCLCSRPE